MKRLIAIAIVWIGCTVAWFTLGSTLVHRSDESSYTLVQEVQGLWGPNLRQAPPSATVPVPRQVTERVTNYDALSKPYVTTVERTVIDYIPISLTSSDIETRVSLEHRRKGLLWFPTYTIDFQSMYTFENKGEHSGSTHFLFPLHNQSNFFDGFAVSNADGSPVEAIVKGDRATWQADLKAGESISFRVVYSSRGTSEWTYGAVDGGIGNGTQVEQFSLSMATDFADIDFPSSALSPTTHQIQNDGWTGEWAFSSLVSNQSIGIKLPQMLNPGPLAAKITFFGPVGLLFFFFVVAVLGEARGHAIHPMNYFLIGCAFFAFHLLFAYLVDHLSILVSFGISAAVSVILVTSYARLFVGWRFALAEIGVSQLIYLVLFSYTFFWNGFTGLAITIGAIITLFVMMQITGRTRWADKTPSTPPPEVAACA